LIEIFACNRGREIGKSWIIVPATQQNDKRLHKPLEFG